MTSGNGSDLWFAVDGDLWRILTVDTCFKCGRCRWAEYGGHRCGLVTTVRAKVCVDSVRLWSWRVQADRVLTLRVPNV